MKQLARAAFNGLDWFPGMISLWAWPGSACGPQGVAYGEKQIKNKISCKNSGRTSKKKISTNLINIDY